MGVIRMRHFRISSSNSDQYRTDQEGGAIPPGGRWRVTEARWRESDGHLEGC